MPIDSEVLTTKEAAVFLRAHVETVRRLATRGAIPSFKVGKDWRFRKEALIRWSEEQRSPSKKPLVLIVDDDEGICRALSRVVAGIGCRMSCATDGAEGLALVAKEEPDVILLDLMMLNMNGPQFLEKLRATHPDLPVVIVTAYPDSELMTEAIKHGPLMLLSKPFEASQVQKLVTLVVGGRAIANVRTKSEASAP